MYTKSHSKKLPLILSLTATAIGIIILFALLYAHHNKTVHYQLTYTPKPYTKTADALNNPYQGWYHMYGYLLSDYETISPYTIEDNIKSSTEADGDPGSPQGSHQLALLEINLKNYADKDLSETALSQLETILSAWEASGLHLILRFLYDWDGEAMLTEPESTSTILRHMDQAAEIVNRHAKMIYLMQGLFTGNYGEMHNTVHNDIRLLAEHWASVTDDSIYLSVRTPQHWRKITESFSPLTDTTAWKGTTASRLGLFNDGMLGSATDLGTYNDSIENQFTSASAIKDFFCKGSREEELDFQDSLCSYVPNGGEVVIDNTYNDFENAIASFAKMHVSYLNGDYDSHVLDKWKNAVYLGSDCFHRMNGLDYIGRHLGYRYAATDSGCEFENTQDNLAALRLTIKNHGFSCCCRPFTSKLTLFNTDTGETTTLTVDSDARTWRPGTPVSLSVPFDAQQIGEGSFMVYFSLTDDTDGRQIQLANTLEQDSTYGYLIASMQISQK